MKGGVDRYLVWGVVADRGEGCREGLGVAVCEGTFAGVEAGGGGLEGTWVGTGDDGSAPGYDEQPGPEADSGDPR